MTQYVAFTPVIGVNHAANIQKEKLSLAQQLQSSTEAPKPRCLKSNIKRGKNLQPLPNKVISLAVSKVKIIMKMFASFPASPA